MGGFRLLFVALGALIVAGFAAAWGAGLFGPADPKAIDLVRLGAVALFLVAAVVAASAPAGDRRKFPVLAMATAAQAPLSLNAHSALVQWASAVVILFTLFLLAVSVLRSRHDRRASAG